MYQEPHIHIPPKAKANENENTSDSSSLEEDLIGMAEQMFNQNSPLNDVLPATGSPDTFRQSLGQMTKTESLQTDPSLIEEMKNSSSVFPELEAAFLATA